MALGPGLNGKVGLGHPSASYTLSCTCLCILQDHSVQVAGGTGVLREMVSRVEERRLLATFPVTSKPLKKKSVISTSNRTNVIRAVIRYHELIVCSIVNSWISCFFVAATYIYCLYSMMYMVLCTTLHVKSEIGHRIVVVNATHPLSNLTTCVPASLHSD